MAGETDSLREQLQKAAPELGPVVIGTLADALAVKKRVSVRRSCEKHRCNCTTYVDVPDASAAVSAAKVLMEHTSGRPGVQGQGDTGPKLIIKRAVWPRGAPMATVGHWLGLVDSGDLETLREELAALVDGVDLEKAA